MKVILAFDSFKGCLTAQEACHIAASACLARHPGAHVVCLPMSDGGEGLVDCLTPSLQLRQVRVSVHDPLMRPITAAYAVSPDGQTAYMEMAAASGLTLVAPSERDPIGATTFGVGEMLLDAVRRGCRRVVMGIGGSATCDGGEGMLRCLRPSLPLPVSLTVASDVVNPLYGREGAAYVFAPQKGATPAQVEQLDQRLRQWAARCEAQGVPASLSHHPGAGAAGGLGYALMAFLDARLTPGIDLFLDAVGFDAQLHDADLVITGEGSSDRQTLMGKVPQGVLHRASLAGVPVALFSGAVSDRELLIQAGFAQVRSINEHCARPLSELLRPDVARQNLQTSIQSLNLQSGIFTT